MGRRRPFGGDSNGGGTGCGVCVDGLAGVEGDAEQMGGAAGGESGDRSGRGLQVSGDERARTNICRGTAGVSVCTGILEFSGDPGTAGCAIEVANDAGSVVLRWAGICASAEDGVGEPSGDSTGPADDRVRKKHFDWHARFAWRREGRMGTIEGWRGNDWGGASDKGRRKTGVCLSGTSGVARVGGAADAFRL